MYSGEIDKGCGNQVFDYSKTITVEEDNDFSEQDIPRAVAASSESPRESSPPRSETRTLNHSIDGTLELPVIDLETDSSAPPSGPPTTTSVAPPMAGKSTTPRSARMSARMAAKLGPDSEESETPRKEISLEDFANQDVSMLQQIREMTR